MQQSHIQADPILHAALLSTESKLLPTPLDKSDKGVDKKHGEADH